MSHIYIYIYDISSVRVKILEVYILFYMYHTKCLKVCLRNTCSRKVKVKQSHYRPGQALRVPGG